MQPTDQPDIVEPSDQLYVIRSTQNVNGRSCPSISCRVVRTYSPGQAISVAETVQGDAVSGSVQWRRIDNATEEIYIHASVTFPLRQVDSVGFETSQGVFIEFRRMELEETILENRPASGDWLIVYGTLQNNSNRQVCDNYGGLEIVLGDETYGADPLGSAILAYTRSGSHVDLHSPEICLEANEIEGFYSIHAIPPVDDELAAVLVYRNIRVYIDLSNLVFLSDV